jgi:hypothetical protein
MSSPEFTPRLKKLNRQAERDAKKIRSQVHKGQGYFPVFRRLGVLGIFAVKNKNLGLASALQT